MSIITEKLDSMKKQLVEMCIYSKKLYTNLNYRNALDDVINQTFPNAIHKYCDINSTCEDVRFISTTYTIRIVDAVYTYTIKNTVRKCTISSSEFMILDIAFKLHKRSLSQKEEISKLSKQQHDALTEFNSKFASLMKDVTNSHDLINDYLYFFGKIADEVAVLSIMVEELKAGKFQLPEPQRKSITTSVDALVCTLHNVVSAHMDYMQQIKQNKQP